MQKEKSYSGYVLESIDPYIHGDIVHTGTSTKQELTKEKS